MKRILVIGSKTSRDYGLFSDLLLEKDVDVFYSDELIAFRTIGSTPLKLIRRIVFSQKVNKIINIPKKWIWLKYYDLLKRIKDYEVMLIVDTALFDISNRMLMHFRKKNPKLKKGLLVINTMNKNSYFFRTIKDKIFDNPWDTVFTYDSGDAEKYGWRFEGFHYYSVDTEVEQKNVIDTDAVFIGALVGGRNELIEQTSSVLCQNGVNCNFICFSWDDPSTWKGIPGIKYLSTTIPYKEALETTLRSNCVIEILQEMQRGPSLRFFEAVCYNKKLLTTNENIVNFPFYNPHYMKIFHKPEDIDINWIIKRENIDYGYHGEFSPVHLIDSIKALYSKAD